jgi:predicted phosphoribosyltransferase/dienelactone hydrolase
MPYRNRKDAGEKLAIALKRRAFEDPVVLGIPRGGVPVAAAVARTLGRELAVVVARKLGAPGNPELAIGAITGTGVSYINTAVAAAAGADVGYIEAEKARQVREAHRREQLFDSHRRPSVKGRTVIIVDDGVATGATAIAAVRSIKAAGAKTVVLAIPVGPPEMVEFLRAEADEVVCLEEDPGFWAVGQYYLDFSQVSDEDVRQTLESFAPAAFDPGRHIEIVRDGVRLAGKLISPLRSGPVPLVIFVHGLGSSKESPRNVAIANRLVDAGIATLLFDLSGHGESSTDPREGMDAYVADLIAAFAWANRQDEINQELIGIAGSSLGATVTVRAVCQGLVTPQTLVLRAPPIGPEELRRLHVPSLVLIGSRDPLRSDVERGVADNPRISLSIVEGASHLFEEPGTLEEALRLTVDWFTSKFFTPVASRSQPA